MIHISLGTMGNKEGRGDFGYIENINKGFHTADDALAWYESMGFKTDSDSGREIIKASAHEYVQVELEVLAEDGRTYTNLMLSIEGQQGQHTYMHRLPTLVADKVVVNRDPISQRWVQIELYGRNLKGETMWGDAVIQNEATIAMPTVMPVD